MHESNLIEDVSDYYSEKLIAFGDTPEGVDWNGEDGQINRFDQLFRLFEAEAKFSLTDLGCGYGALLDYLLQKRLKQFDYLGLDVSDEMIKAAKARCQLGRFEVNDSPAVATDFIVASGIFNVRLHYSDVEWLTHIQNTLDKMQKYSRLGFAFNCLTSYSDADKKRGYLYYADPCYFFDLCKRKYSKQVALLHDYGLYEFTILVRK